MGVLSEALDALKSVVLLQDEVKRLANNTAKLAERLDEVRTIAFRLDAHQKDAPQLAAQAAKLAVNDEVNSLKERVLKIEMFLSSQETRPPAAAILISNSRPHDAGDAAGEPMKPSTL